MGWRQRHELRSGSDVDDDGNHLIELTRNTTWILILNSSLLKRATPTCHSHARSGFDVKVIRLEWICDELELEILFRLFLLMSLSGFISFTSHCYGILSSCLQHLNFNAAYVDRGITYYDKKIRMDANPIKTALNVCKYLISQRVSVCEAYCCTTSWLNLLCVYGYCQRHFSRSTISSTAHTANFGSARYAFANGKWCGQLCRFNENKRCVCVCVLKITRLFHRLCFR